MKIGEIEVSKISRGIHCEAAHSHRLAVVSYNGTAQCGECFANELLDTSDGREILGSLLAGLIEDSQLATFQTKVSR